jgi:predicted  nucleic acid-binding Zn-ribbon protein
MFFKGLGRIDPTDLALASPMPLFHSIGPTSPKETMSMSEFQETTIQSSTATPRWVGLAIGALGAVSLLGIGIGVSALNQAKNVEQTTQASMKQQNDALAQRLTKSDEQNQQLQSDLKVVTSKLNVTQDELVNARKQSKVAAATYNKKLSGLESNVNSQLASKASTEDVTKLNGDVTGVKNELDATNQKLERATGDMGVMSGLIARNQNDLDELKRKGDRNYFEFTIQKSKTPQHVGPVQIALNKVDQKKSKYTMTVLADDKTIEKKDKTAGEPVQFYVKGVQRYAPYELVVFEVGKNQVTGYLSTPKSVGTATSASNSGQ